MHVTRGPSKKKQQEDREVNAAVRGSRKHPPTNQKESRPFRHPPDAEKWCEIHYTTGYDLEECRTYLDCKNMREKLAAQELR
jgi:hypothetical protein